MRSKRDIIRRARRDVQEHLCVPALYLPTRDATPVPCAVRVHTSNAALGNLSGSNFGYAERVEFTPSVLIWREDITAPVRNAIISVEPGEAYLIDYVAPPDDLTIKANVVPLSAAEAAGLPVPESQ
jgi:hypothetical protein